MLGAFTVVGMAQETPAKDKKYSVISKRCDGCGHCFRACRDKALLVDTEGKAIIDPQKCKGCGDCLRFCRRMAIVEVTPGQKS